MSDRAKLLLVDDRPENLLALEAILEPLDADLVRADSGEEALRRLLHEEFAAILLDVQMPGMDGFQTAELIKQRERTRHVPILFLTAISKDAEHVFRGYSAGAVDYLMKPFEPLILRAKVAVFIELWQKTVEIRRRDALLAEQELATVERESELRYRSLADAVPQIVWTAGTDGVVNYRNERWYELTGLPRDGTSVWQEFVHPDDAAATGAAWEEALRTRTPLDAEYRIRLADGTYRWFLGRALPTADGWVGTSTDIEDRKLAEERQAFIAEAGWVLGSSLDYEQTLADVARLAVPRVADWCAVDIFVDGRLQRLALEHADPIKLALARELEEPMLSAVAVATRTTEPVLVKEIGERELAAFRFNADQLEIARALAPRSYVTVPLAARGEVFGSVTLVTAESGRVYGDEDAATRPGARPPRRRRDRQRAAVRRVGAAQQGGARARGRRRRRRPGRPQRRDPALEHGRSDDHRCLRGGDARPPDRGRRPPLGGDRAADPGCEPARRARPRGDGAGRVRRPRALDLRLRGRLRGGHRLRLPRPDRGEGASRR